MCRDSNVIFFRCMHIQISFISDICPFRVIYIKYTAIKKSLMWNNLQLFCRPLHLDWFIIIVYKHIMNYELVFLVQHTMETQMILKEKHFNLIS
jgi:hypothetical protein